MKNAKHLFQHYENLTVLILSITLSATLDFWNSSRATYKWGYNIQSQNFDSSLGICEQVFLGRYKMLIASNNKFDKKQKLCLTISKQFLST